MKNKESKKKKKEPTIWSPNEGDMTKKSSGAPNSNLLQLKSIELAELVPKWSIQLIKNSQIFLENFSMSRKSNKRNGA